MPASSAATAPAITEGSNRIAKNHGAARHGDPAGDDKFAAALDPGRQLIDLRLEPHDLVAMVAVVQGAPVSRRWMSPSLIGLSQRLRANLSS